MSSWHASAGRRRVGLSSFVLHPRSDILAGQHVGPRDNRMWETALCCGCWFICVISILLIVHVSISQQRLFERRLPRALWMNLFMNLSWEIYFSVCSNLYLNWLHKWASSRFPLFRLTIIITFLHKHKLTLNVSTNTFRLIYYLHTAWAKMCREVRVILIQFG